MNRSKFFSSLQSALGSLSNDNKEGFGLILDEADKRLTPKRELAYMFATAWWETGRTMQPVREAFYINSNFDKAEAWRKKNLHYYPYYGRGYVQLTWKANYRKASDKLGVNFVNNPDEVMKPEHSVKIMFDGMAEGWFTGKKLDDYIDEIDEPASEDLQEYVDARRIINGKDKALTIAKLAVKFESALAEAGYGGNGLPPPAGGVVALPAGSGTPAGTGAETFEQHIASLGLKHFKAYEFLVKGAQNDNPSSPAFGLNTDPPRELWDNIDATAKVLDKLRAKLERPITMLSVYRSTAYNTAIGGAGDSQHTHFRAIDFVVQGSPVGPLQWAQVLRSMRADGVFKGGIGVYQSFVHVDTRGYNADW